MAKQNHKHYVLEAHLRQMGYGLKSIIHQINMEEQNTGIFFDQSNNLPGLLMAICHFLEPDSMGYIR